MGMFDKIKKAANDAIDSGKTGIASFRESGTMTETIVKHLAKINYDVVIQSLQTFEAANPKLNIAVRVIQRIKIAVDNYNESEHEDKNNILFDDLQTIKEEFDLKTVIELLEPIANNIPFGGILVMALKLIISLATKKQ